MPSPRPVPSSAHPVSRVLRHPRTTTHSQRTTSPETGGLASTSPPSPTRGRGEETQGTRGPQRGRGGPRAGAGATALTFPGPPGWRRVIQQGPGRRRRARGWRRGELGPRWRPLQTSTATLDTHQATFWEPNSPPATAAAATAPAPASVMAGAALRASKRARAGRGESRGWGRKPRRGEVGREEVRGGEGTGRRREGGSEGAGWRAGEEAEGSSEVAEASRGRPPGSERGRSAGLRRPRLPRAEPAGTSAVRRPPASPGWRQRRAVGGG